MNYNFASFCLEFQLIDKASLRATCACKLHSIESNAEKDFILIIFLQICFKCNSFRCLFPSDHTLKLSDPCFHFLMFWGFRCMVTLVWCRVIKLVRHYLFLMLRWLPISGNFLRFTFVILDCAHCLIQNSVTCRCTHSSKADTWSLIVKFNIFSIINSCSELGHLLIMLDRGLMLRNVIIIGKDLLLNWFLIRTLMNRLKVLSWWLLSTLERAIVNWGSCINLLGLLN